MMTPMGCCAVIMTRPSKRAGKVFNVVGIQSLHPRVLRASIALYQTLMMGEGALPRWTRELLAVVVSRANGCHY